METEREVAAAEVPGTALRVFEDLAEAYDDDPVAQVLEIDRRRREYACGECNIHMPFEKVASLMSETTELVQCPACSRILYLAEETRGALTPK